MTHEEYVARQRIKAVEIASKILDGQIGLIEGVRKLVSLQNEIGNSNDEEFLVFKGVESETDTFPIGDARKNWSEAVLEEKDAEAEEYEGQVREAVAKACRRFIQKYGG